MSDLPPPPELRPPTRTALAIKWLGLTIVIIAFLGLAALAVYVVKFQPPVNIINNLNFSS